MSKADTIRRAAPLLLDLIEDERKRRRGETGTPSDELANLPQDAA